MKAIDRQKRKKLRWLKTASQAWVASINDIPVFDQEPLELLKSKALEIASEKIDYVIAYSLAPLYHIPLFKELGYLDHSTRGRMIIIENDERVIKQFERNFPDINLENIIFKDALSAMAAITLYDPKSQKVEIFAPGNLFEIFREEIIEVQRVLQLELEDKSLAKLTLKKRIADWIDHSVNNAEILKKRTGVYSFKDLHALAKGKKAIFLCPGPGLQIAINKLKEMPEDQRRSFFLMAVNSAIKPFEQEGIRLDAILCIESLDVSAYFESWTDYKNPFLLVPHFVNPKVMSLPFEKIVVCQTKESPFILPEKGLNKSEEMHNGPTVATMGFALSEHMGFKRVYLAGLDLCFEENKIYSENTMAGSLRLKEDSEGRVVLNQFEGSKKHYKNVFGDDESKEIFEIGEDLGETKFTEDYDGIKRRTVLPMLQTLDWIRNGSARFKSEYLQLNRKAAKIDFIKFSELNLSGYKGENEELIIDFSSFEDKGCDLRWVKASSEITEKVKLARTALKIIEQANFDLSNPAVGKAHKKFREALETYNGLDSLFLPENEKFNSISGRAADNNDIKNYFSELIAKIETLKTK